MHSAGVQTTDPPDTEQDVVRRQSTRVVGVPTRSAHADVGEDVHSQLLTEPVLIINQRVTRGRPLEYSISTPDGQPIGAVREVHRTLLTKARDSMSGRKQSTRAYRLRVIDANSHVLLTLTRPYERFKMLHTMIVEGPDGSHIGTITQETLGFRGAQHTHTHCSATSPPPQSLGAAALGL